MHDLFTKGRDTLETFLSKVAFESTFWKVNFRKWAMSHWKVRIESLLLVDNSTHSDDESIVFCLLLAAASQNIQVQFANASVG